MSIQKKLLKQLICSAIFCIVKNILYFLRALPKSVH